MDGICIRVEGNLEDRGGVIYKIVQLMGYGGCEDGVG